MKTDLSKWAVLFAALLIISASMGNSFAQEADPQQRLNQINVELIKLEGMLEYNGTIRNNAARLYTQLTTQKEKLMGIRETLTKKIEAAKSVADPVETPDVGVKTDKK